VQAIYPTKAPNLPVAPLQYEQRYQNQLLNDLRLYFNLVDNSNQQVVEAIQGLTTLQWLGDD